MLNSTFFCVVFVIALSPFHNWNLVSGLTVNNHLQDFLRNIPGSLLSGDLYDQWMDSMEQEGGDQKMEAIQR